MAKDGDALDRLQKLLNESSQLTSMSDRPALKRDVSQLHESSLRLRRQITTQKPQKEKAVSLLAAKGFDVSKMSKLLEPLKRLKPAAEHPLEPIWETDVEGYLKHQYQSIILSAIEEAKSQTTQDFHEKFRLEMEQDWSDVKPQFSETLGHKIWQSQKPAASARDVSQQREPQLLQPAAYKALEPTMAAYAGAVVELNRTRIAREPCAVMSLFKVGCTSIDDKDPRRKQLLDCWQLLECMLQRNAPQQEFCERTFEQEYLSSSQGLQQQFVFGAKQFLEEQYLRIVKQFVHQRPVQAAPGGDPSVPETVLAYLRAKHPRGWPEQWDLDARGDPIWALLYYCIRCGRITEAHRLAEERAGRQFVSFLEHYAKTCSPDYAQRQITTPASTWEKIRAEYYNARSRSQDPYKHALFAIIGRCDTKNSFPNVAGTIQDFMWLKLTQIKLGEFDQGDFTLKDLQHSLYKTWGPSWFNAQGNSPLIFFQVLLMSQQFERAIQYLVSTERYNVEAVHVAAALHYYGALRQLDSADKKWADKLFHEDEEADVPAAINVRHLLELYVRVFANSNPAEAVHYLFLLRNEQERERSICELVLFTREYDLILGTALEDGSRQNGVVDELMPDEAPGIAHQVADRLVHYGGRYADAARLYFLAGTVEAYAKVLLVLNNQMRLVMTQQSEERNAIEATARDYYERFNSVRFRQRSVFHALEAASEQHRATARAFHQMLVLMHFFGLYFQRRYGDALVQIRNLDILPLDPETLSQKVEGFVTLAECVRANFSDVLLVTMDVLYQLYNSAQQQQVAGGASARQLLQDSARSLVTFAGMIQPHQFHMSGDTHARLVKMQVYMN